MTTGPRSQCSVCTHFRSGLLPDTPNGEAFCAAFPGGIPDAVYYMALDHRQPIDGDHGVRWTSDGHPYPELIS